MKINTKLISTVRLRPDRAKMLKDKCFELSMKSGELINEADIVNFLIDKVLIHIDIQGDELIVRVPTGNK